MAGLFVATPCFGGMVTTLYAGSLLKLAQACAGRAVELKTQMLGGDALVTRARANLVANFLDEPAMTHLLFIDADIGFEPDQAFRLLDFDADITAAIYPVKRVNWAKAKSLFASGHPDPAAASLDYVMEVADPARVGVRDGFIQVRYAGTGFMMIRRAALEAMCRHFPELKFRRQHAARDEHGPSENRFALFDCMIDPATGTYLSEDYSFCARWTAMGGEIWADAASRLVHVGPTQYAGDLSTQFGRAPSP
ncbi:MAG TPA: hypothetical protein VM689_14085 [Aliidongia sp.]|nr:hypothetical protein [Aliidongia sp.]